MLLAAPHSCLKLSFREMGDQDLWLLGSQPEKPPGSCWHPSRMRAQRAASPGGLSLLVHCLNPTLSSVGRQWQV